MDFLIDVIESAGGGEHGEELVDAFVPLILAFNQHFVGRNVITKLITVKLLQLRLLLPSGKGYS